jgi:hypothetical protein
MITISINGETPKDVLDQMYKLLGINVTPAPGAEGNPAPAPEAPVSNPEAEKPRRGRKPKAKAAEPEDEDDVPVAEPMENPSPTALPVTLQDLKAKLMQLAEKDSAAPLEVLQKFGADRLSALPQNKIGAAYAEAQAMLNEAAGDVIDA